MHVVLDRKDEASRPLLGNAVNADVEPHRRVERRVLVDHEVLELVGERVAVGLAREIAALEAGACDGVDHPVDHLLHAPFTDRRAELAAEVLGRHDVRGGLRPELGYFDALLLEDVAALSGDHRVAKLPLDLVIRVNALAREAATEPKAEWFGVLDGHLCDVGDGHVRAPLESRDVRCARDHL